MKRLIVSILVTLLLTVTAVPVFAANTQGTQVLDHVVISPIPATVATSGTCQFTAVGQDALNQAVSGVSYTWEVVAGGGTINSAGLFTAGTTAGTFTNTILVTAIKGEVTITSNATVTVAVPGLLDHVAISPDTLVSPVSGTQQFTAESHDAFCQVVSDVTYTWEVVSGGGAIDDTGLFIAGTTTGTFTDTVVVTAKKGDISKTANVTVIIATPGILDHVVISPVTATILTSGTQKFTATAEDAFNQPVTDLTSCTWEVVAEGGTIDDTGLFTAGTIAGTYTDTVNVTVVKGDISVTARATVTINTPNENESRNPPGWLHGKKTGWHGADTPPGWSKGKKTGWNGENMPPGKMAKNK